MTIRSLFPMLLLPLAGCALSAQSAPSDRGPTVSRTLALTGFDSISLAGCDIASVRHGARFAVTARGPQRDLALLEADTRGSRLVLDRKKDGCKDGYVPLAIEITMPALREVELSGATRMAAARFSGPRFEAELSGATELDLTGLETPQAELRLSGASELRATAIMAQSVALDLSGASEADIAGSARELAIGGSGASEADTRDLSAPQVTATASGTASIRAYATRTAALSASGTSSIRVTGGATCTLSKGGQASAFCD